MASGITHARVASTGAVLLTASAAALYAAGYPAHIAAGVAVGAVAGLLVSPDIDHHVRTHEEQRIYRMFGPVVGALHQVYWLPYEKVFDHHGQRHALTLGAKRGVSHWLVIGTLTRFVYLLAPLLLALWVAGVPLPPWAWPFGVAMFAAWAVQDALHLVWDAF